MIRHCAPPRRHTVQSGGWLPGAVPASFGGTRTFHPRGSDRDMLTTAAASSARLFPRDTRSRDVLRRMYAENRGALVGSEHCRIAVLRPPFSAIDTDGRHDRFGSSSRSLWLGLSE